MTRQFSLLFAIYISTHLNIASTQAAFPAYPHEMEHLKQYGQQASFGPTVQLIDCSASRIEIDPDDPVDFYITAAHCNKFITITDDFAKREGLTTQHYIPNIRIPHPSMDLALLVTNKKTERPRYTLYKGDLYKLIGQTVTSVGFGVDVSNPSSQFEVQAFETTLEDLDSRDLNKGNIFISTPLIAHPYLSPNDPPVGAATPGDSGGSLLIKEEGIYKLVGVTKAGKMTPDRNRITTYYKEIPDAWKNNDQHRLCDIVFRNNPSMRIELCYGSMSAWTAIDLNFIKNAKKDIMDAVPVYTYPEATKPGTSSIAVKMSDDFHMEDDHFDFAKNECIEQHLILIGRASQYAQIIILIDQKSAFNLPLQIGRSTFLYHNDGTDYPVEVIVEKALHENAFIVKAEIFNTTPDLPSTLEICPLLPSTIMNHAVKMDIHFLSQSERPPLEVTLEKCLSKNNFIHTDLLESKSDGDSIMGYVSDYYEVVFRLDGKEIKRISNQEGLRPPEVAQFAFEFNYQDNAYKTKIYWLRDTEHYINAEDFITVSCEIIPSN